jgi:predicted O-linked N-acetylglucosamine transferase (SPINDLY family)
LADTVVVGDQDAGGAPASVEESAHQAAFAEGATAVQAQSAAESAAEASAAAEAALAAAAMNLEGGAAVAQATEAAQGAAASAQVSAEMVMEALQAQTQAINTLTEELKASRRAASAEDKPRRSPPSGDREPGSGGPKWKRR